MKKLLIIALMLTGMSSFAQDDATVKGNKVTMKDTAPVWKGCEDSGDKKNCFNKMLSRAHQRKYQIFQKCQGQYIRGKATVSMEVNEKGKVVINSVESKSPELKKEAKRLMESIPPMTPGKLGRKTKDYQI